MRTRSGVFLFLMSLGACLALVAMPVDAQKGKDEKKDQSKMDESQRQDVQTLLTAIDGVQSGQPVPTGIPITWEQNHFIKAQAGKTYVPFTLSIDPTALSSPSVAMYLRVVDRKMAPAPTPATKNDKKDDKDKDKDKKDGRVEYAFEDVHFLDVKMPETGPPFRLSRAFSVAGGDYDVYVAIKERAAPGTKPPAGASKMSVLKQPLTVPDFWGTELTTSGLILSSKVDQINTPLTPDQQIENPYTIGVVRLTPSLDNKFSKKNELNIIFWVYGAAVDDAKKPNVTIEYSFYQKTADTEKFFNKTNPQTVNAQSLPPQFDYAAGHQLPGSLTIPLTSFPEGDYRLEIKVTDNIAKKTITREVQFSVTA